MRGAELRACFGAPDRVEAGVWSYRFVDGGDCYWATELQLRLRAGRVLRARTRRATTGMHCERVPGF